MRYTDEQILKVIPECKCYLDVLRKLGGSLKSGASLTHMKKRVIKLGVDCSHFKSPGNISADNRKLTADEILVYDRLNGSREKTNKLDRALKEKGVDMLCGECNIKPEWQSKYLRLEVDHIDGDCLNNIITNLRYLCPNCHTQTETYGNRNK